MLRFAATCVLASLLGGCAASNPDVVLYPSSGEAARRVLSFEFQRQITLPDNFVLRPDEYAGVATDHRRNLLYVGGREGTLLALDATAGEVVWERPFNGEISSIPLLLEDEDLLLFGTDNGEFIALDLQTREPRWIYETAGTVRAEPLVSGGLVYFTNSRDQVYALDVATGDWRWQYPTESELPTDFTIYGRAGLSYMTRGDAMSGDGVLFTGFDDGRVVALGAISGAALWTFSVAPPERGDFIDADATPLIVHRDGVVVVSGQSTGVYGLSIENGAEQWKTPVRGAGTAVAGPGGVMVVASALEGVMGLEPGGKIRWHQQTEPGVLSTPLVVGDTVFVTHSEIGLLAYDVRNGELLARVDSGSGSLSAPTYDPKTDRFYLITNRGMLLAFRVEGV